MKKLVIAALLVFAGVACSDGQEDYDLPDVEVTQPADQAEVELAAAALEAASQQTEATEGINLCDIVDAVGYGEARAEYQETPPQIGTDEFEGRVFDYWYSRYC